MKKRIFSITLSLLLLIVSITITMKLIGNKHVPSKANKHEASISVKIQRVQNQIIKSTFVYRGRVNSFENVSLSSEVFGKILSGDVPFKEGQAFEKGDVLVRIFEEDLQAVLKASKSSFLSTISKILPDMKVDYPDSYSKWLAFFNAIKIDQDLPILPGIVSEKEKIYLASNNVLTAYYTLQEQEINLRKNILIAPFDGYFKSVSREVGAIATSGSELAGIIRSDLLEVEVPIPVNKVKRIHLGDQVVLKNNYTQLKGKVSRISGFVDASTQSVTVFIKVKNQNRQLMEGEYVDVNFSSLSEVAGIELPREVIFDQNKVYVVEDNCLREKDVDIISVNDDMMVVVGLADGDMVVDETLVNVKEGILVSTY
jgi:multidrug efflux pump subunit AcrA (membrane-fusion protein)